MDEFIDKSRGAEHMLHTRVVLDRPHMKSLPFLVLCFCSCMATTGTITSLTQTKLQEIKQLGIVATTTEGFSVRISRHEKTAVGGAMFGLVGAMVEAGTRSYNDGTRETELSQHLDHYDVAKVLGERLYTHLESAKAFSAVKNVNTENSKDLKGMGIDSELKVTINEWGLRLCSTALADQVQAAYNIQGKLLRLDDESVVWEHNELYLDGECRPFTDFRSTQGLLQDVLSRAADGVAARIANDILFP